MTVSRPLWVAVALVALLVWTASGMAQAARGDRAVQAAAFVQKLGAELLAIQVVAGSGEGAGDGAAAARSAQLEGLIRRGFDLDLTSQLVLGKYWNRASQAHRQAFKELFAQYLLHSYARHLKTYRVDTLEIISSNPVGNRDYLVETQVEIAREDGSAHPVWRLRRRDGDFKIIDVHVDGISLTLTERNQFGSVIRRKGLDGMLSDLHARVAGRAPLAADGSALALRPVGVFASPGISKIDLLLRQR